MEKRKLNVWEKYLGLQLKIWELISKIWARFQGILKDSKWYVNIRKETKEDLEQMEILNTRKLIL